MSYESIQLIIINVTGERARKVYKKLRVNCSN